jgi:hypothetical protein
MSATIHKSLSLMLSAMAGVTWWNFYFRLFPGTVRSPQVVEFLTHLLRHLPGPVLVIWDRLQTHRSRLVRDFVAAQQGRLTLELFAGVRAGAEPGGVHLGTLEAA